MNKTIKIIDLLIKIANGEEVPKTIKYEDQLWKYNPYNDFEGLGYGGCLLNRVCLNELNNTVEIIEENKLEDRFEFSLSNGIWTTKQASELIDNLSKLEKRLIDHISKIEEKLDER